jgi:hypothetical protein
VDCLAVDGFMISITIDMGIKGSIILVNFVVLVAFDVLIVDLTW